MFSWTCRGCPAPPNPMQTQKITDDLLWPCGDFKQGRAYRFPSLHQTTVPASQLMSAARSSLESTPSCQFFNSHVALILLLVSGFHLANQLFKSGAGEMSFYLNNRNHFSLDEFCIVPLKKETKYSIAFTIALVFMRKLTWYPYST